MASELMFRIIHEKPFSNCVMSILEVSAMTLQDFSLTSHAQNFYVDLSRTYKNGMLNGNMLFELFGEFSSEPSDKVRRCMINSVKNDVMEFNTCCRTALQLKGLSGEQWIHNMENTSTAGDELCLFLLGRIYFRHSTVLTKYNMWSTIDIALRVPDQELISCSSIKLVYMGSNAYGILRSKNVAVVPPGVPLTIPSGNSVITHQLNPARGITYRRRVGRFRSAIPSSRGNRLITSMPGYSSMGLPPRQYHQTRRRTIPLCPTPYVLSPPSRSMGTRTRRRTTNIPSQYRNLYRGSPARPLNQVSTIPGYSFSNKSWTTTGWQPAQEERLSPEVASLLQNLQGSSKDTNTVTSLKSSTTATTSTPRSVDIPLIVIDEESPVLTEEPQNSNANLGKNPYDMENINCNSGLLTVETDTGSTEARASTPVSPDESSNSSKDSTLELLQDFGKVLHRSHHSG